MKKFLLVAAISMAATAANATTFVFKGDGQNVSPEGVLNTDFVQNCGTVGDDFCSTGDHTAGLRYLRDGIEVTARAYAGGVATRLIQDVIPSDSGLGAFSESNSSDDQTQADSREAIEFDFGDSFVSVTDVEFNAGGDVNCTNNSDGSGEGSCGSFQLDIFDVDDMMILSTVIDITNIDDLPFLGVGRSLPFDRDWRRLGLCGCEVHGQRSADPGRDPASAFGPCRSWLCIASEKARLTRHWFHNQF